MNVEEKRALVNAYCMAIHNCCEDCVLNNKPWEHTVRDSSGEFCLCIADADESELDKALVLIGRGEDPVNRPAHYTDGKIEVIDYIEDKKLGFCLGNAIKYISRAGKKNPDKEVEDLNKAIWYINRRIKEIQEANV